MRELLTRIKNSNVLLEVVDGKLKLFVNAAGVDPALIAEIKEKKEALFQYLSANTQESFNDAFKKEIPVIPAAESYPLSSSQKRLWMQSQLEEENAMYNIPGVFVLEGTLNKSALEYAFGELVIRHEILRTVFRANEQGEGRQFIRSAEQAEVKITYTDLRNAHDPQSLLQDLLHTAYTTPFDLSAGPLLKAGLYQLSEEKWIFGYVMHHIISDGWSMEVLVKELLLLYNAYTNGEASQLIPLRIQYKDYAAWQQAFLSGDTLETSKNYWLKQLQAPLPVLQLPADRPRPAVKTYHGDSVDKMLDVTTSKGLKMLAQDQGATLFMSVLAVVNVLLYRYTEQQDFIIGSPIAGREHLDLENQIGFYLNTISLRTKCRGSERFSTLLDQVKQTTLEAFEHQLYPFDELVDVLQLKKDTSRNLLFDVMVLLQNFNVHSHGKTTQTLGDINVSAYEDSEHAISKYDLTFYFTEAGDRILTNIEYNTDIFNRETIIRMGDYLEKLIHTIILYPAVTIDEIIQNSIGNGRLIPQINTLQSGKSRSSEHQKRLWFIDQFEKDYLYTGSPVYHNLPLIARWTTTTDIEQLQQSIQKVVDAYPVLKTKIIAEDSEPFQLIHETAVTTLQQHTISSFSNEDGWISKCRQIIELPFDIEKDLLIRFNLLSDGTKTLFIITAHHLIADRKSLDIVLQEILHYYKGNTIIINSEIPAYAGFAEWQQQLSDRELEPAAYFWKKRLKDAPVLYLDTDQQREHIHVYKGALLSKKLSPVLSGKIRSFCEEYDTTSYFFLLTAFNILLHKYAGTEEVVMGTLYENREHSVLENIIGPVANLLTLRNNITGKDSFIALLQEITAGYKQAVAYAAMPFEKVTLAVNPGKDMSRTALFDVLMHYEEVQSLHGLETVELNYGIGKYDFNFLVRNGEQIELFFTYNKLYFNPSRIERLLDNYINILEGVITLPHQAISQLDYIGQAEKTLLLETFHDSNVSYPLDKTITSLFEEQVLQTPDYIAITFENKQISYASLNASANQLGNYLRSQYDIQPDDLVCIRLEREEWMIIAILGILKAGAAYVPIDPAYPQTRIDYMIADSRCKVVIDAATLSHFLSTEAQYSKDNLPAVNTPDNLAYVIYTSGTTGQPKGTLITHQNVVRLFRTSKPLFDFNASDVWTMFHSYCFDFSVWEMYGALLYGGRLVIISSQTAKDTAAYLEVLHEQGVTVLNQTPSAFYNLINHAMEGTPLPLRLRYIIFGGEALSPGKLADWKSRYPAARLINMYGITETTVHVTYKEITDKEIATGSSSIGKPIPTLSCYILDSNGQLLPVGVSGELYVGGAGVSKGYLNREELTTQRFVNSPFKAGERLYRSGDKARILDNGELEYAGRIDEQVKIRGYRIELGEIENVLLGHELIEEAVLIARKDDNGEYYLVAYIVSRDSLEISSLRTSLALQLPAYMLPAYFVQLDRFPLTSNGKIDRKHLPDPMMQTGTLYVPPRTETEKALAQIWEEILNRTNIGARDNFFESGGHSLKATRLVSQIHKAFNVKVTLKDLFANPVLEDQARLVAQAGKTSFTGISPVPEQSHYVLSSSQRRMWVLSQFEEGNIAYNMPGVFVFEGNLDINALEKSFEALIARHESLRTVFTEDENGTISQVIYQPASLQFGIRSRDLRNEPAQDEKVRQLVQEELVLPFDLAVCPLVRASLYQLENNKWIFIYVIHHIISDGWSMGILIKELLQFYNAYISGETLSIAPLRIQYKDYAAWQQEQLSNEQLKEHKTYWLKQFAGELPVLELPADKVRPLVKTYNGGAAHRKLNPVFSKSVKTLSQEHGATLFMGLLAVVNTLLYKYTGQKDIVIGTPMAGRAHADLENQIGFYINTLALRSQFNDEESYLDLLKHTLEVTVGAYEHQVFPFDELVDELNLQRDMSRNALFDVMVVLQNLDTPDDGTQQKLGDLEISDFKGAWELMSKVDLSFDFVEAGEDLYVSIEYNSDIYEPATITRFIDHLEQVMGVIAANPSMPLRQLDYLSQEEKQYLLTAFNDTATYYPKDKTVTDLFEEQVAAIPTAEALVFEQNVLTYQALNENVNQLAAFLRSNWHIRPDDLIAIKLERSEWMVIAVLAVLKSGAAYVPVDTDYPAERIDYMLSDSQCKLMIDDVLLTRFRAEQHQYAKENIPPVNQPGNLAYVIYTSGSTGQPKGVMVTHGNLVCVWQAYMNAYKLKDANAVLLQMASISFDVFAGDLCRSLLTGGKMIVCPASVKVDPESLYDIISRHRVAMLEGTPGILLPLMDYLYTGRKETDFLKLVLFGSDTLNLTAFREVLQRFRHKMRILNTYGTTETTIDASYYEALAGEELTNCHNAPIGKPFPNMQVLITDNDGHLQPVGVIGEICITGDGVSRGYLGKPELTAQKFVEDPYHKGKRMYKTGDLGRWLPDGNIEFTGRKDDQVKIRGYRIELGEIESTILKYAEVEAAVVMVKTNTAGEKYVVAYVVGNHPLDMAALRSYMAKVLPIYMVPGHFMQLDKLPLTPNEKVDRKKLPDPEGEGMASKEIYIAPRNEKERQLIAVYQEVLKKERIGINDDFFALGGDSIKSIRVVSRLRQYGYKVSIRDIMLYPGVSQLAAHTANAGRAADQGIVEGIIPLSPIQASFLQGPATNKAHYNQSVLLYSKTPVSEEALGAALEKIVLHHDVLRMVYYESAEGWIQENKGAGHGYSLEVLEKTTDAVFKADCDRIQSGINLKEGPLFKAALFKGTEGDYLLLLAHHLIIDGVSWRILFDDLSGLYQQYMSGVPLTLSLKTDSFRFWQERQLEYAHSTVLQREIPYWDNIMSQDISPLPLDDRDGTNIIADTELSSFLLDESQTNHLLTRCYKAYRTDINDILLAALGMALQEQFAMKKILIGMEGHGREDLGTDTDVSATIGWFTTFFPVLLDMRYPEDNIRQLISVKEHMHRIPEKGIGYGILRYLSGKNYQLSPQIIFNYLGDFGTGVTSAKGAPLFEFSGEYKGSEFPDSMEREATLDVSGMIVEGKLRIAVSYSNKQYSASTIVRLMDAYKQHLLQLIAQLSVPDKSYLTPVDLTYKGLTVEQVAVLNSEDNLEDAYPLSPLQEGLYYHWVTAPQSSLYFEQMAYRLKGKLSITTLEKSYQLLVARHAILRTNFNENETGELYQVVKKEVTPVFIYKQAAAEQVAAYKAADRDQGFDLRSDTQMRLTVLDVGEDTFEFVWSHHHILMDGWCVSIIIKEFFQIYYSLLENRTPQLNKAWPYAGYIAWLETLDPAESLHYWKQYLAGYDTIATLPATQGVKKEKPEAREMTFSLGTALTSAIRDLCIQLSITENTFIQTAWSILLGKYNNTDDVVFGAVVSGRPGELEGVEEMIGLFINTIPVRIRLEAENIAQLLKETHRSFVEGTAHHYTQLAQIQAESLLGRNLFDHILVFDNYPVEEMVEQQVDGQAALTLLSTEAFDSGNYDFAIIVSSGEQVSIKFKYHEQYYQEADVKKIQQHFLQVMRNIIEKPTSAVYESDPLSAREKQTQLLAYNNTYTAYSSGYRLHDLFEEQVTLTPDRTALVAAGVSLSYQELNDTANQLAHYLRTIYKIRPDDLIGIQLERNEWMIIAILGVLKSGAAYVPIDPGYPQERIDYMITDSRSKVVINEAELALFKKEQEAFEKVNLKPVNTAADLAYVIYTSGSTGQPKGVMIEHAAIVNTIRSQQSVFGLTGTERGLQFASASFDASVSEIFCIIASGGTLFIVTEEDKKDPVRFEQYLTDNNIEFATLPPAYLQLLQQDKITCLKKLITAGEAAIYEDVKAFAGNYYNAYGPTESSICASVFEVDKDLLSASRNIPIGKPIANTQLYIVDNHNQLLPAGTPGEICIGGAGLARGYLNQPSLTLEKFIQHPFRKGERLYKTGDVGRWLADGNLEFTGRRDEQLKIRGYRIEPGEIENVLLLHPAITAAYVMAREKELVAYFSGTEKITTAGLRAHLGNALPAYMIPGYFVQVEALPLTPNGKVDRKKLPDPEGMSTETSVAYIAPRNDIETQLVLIWQEILGRTQPIGIRDNFFEIGGHSIKVIRLATYIRKAFNVNLDLQLLFNNPTIDGISDMIERINWASAEMSENENTEIISI